MAVAYLGYYSDNDVKYAEKITKYHSK